MAKKSKIQTPDWILNGNDEVKPTKKKGKIFKIRICPECGSDNVSVVLVGEEGKNKGEWECKKCNWIGKNILEKEMSEEEFMIYLDEKGEEVA